MLLALHVLNFTFEILILRFVVAPADNTRTWQAPAPAPCTDGHLSQVNISGSCLKTAPDSLLPQLRITQLRSRMEPAGGGIFRDQAARWG